MWCELPHVASQPHGEWWKECKKNAHEGVGIGKREAGAVANLVPIRREREILAQPRDYVKEILMYRRYIDDIWATRANLSGSHESAMKRRRGTRHGTDSPKPCRDGAMRRGCWSG